MLVKFTADAVSRKAIWLEADLIRVVATSENGNDGAVIYQQDSDTPYFVIDSAEQVVKMVKAGRTPDAGSSQS